MKTSKLFIFVLILAIFTFLSGFNSCNKSSNISPTDLEIKVKQQEETINNLQAYISTDIGIAYINKSKYPLKLRIVYYWGKKERYNEEVISFDSENKKYRYKSFLMVCNDKQEPDTVLFYVESAFSEPNMRIKIGTPDTIKVIDRSSGSSKPASVVFTIDKNPNPDFCDSKLSASGKKIAPRAVYTVTME